MISAAFAVALETNCTVWVAPPVMAMLNLYVVLMAVAGVSSKRCAGPSVRRPTLTDCGRGFCENIWLTAT